jgi:hypothetical protein
MGVDTVVDGGGSPLPGRSVELARFDALLDRATAVGAAWRGEGRHVLLRDAHGETHEIAYTDTLRLSQLSAWRALLEREDVRQPVHQLPKHW